SVIEFFSDYIGPYAYEKIANVQATSHGGMETASAIFYTENLISGKRTEGLRNVIIHELAHQWFGNAVTESTWDDAWLSEGKRGFCNLLYAPVQGTQLWARRLRDRPDQCPENGVCI